MIRRHASASLEQGKARAKEGRTFEALSTLEAHKVKDMDLREQHEAEQARRRERREAAREVVRNGYENASLRASYDAVVATMAGLLKAQTLEMRDVSEVPEEHAHGHAEDGAAAAAALLGDPTSGVAMVAPLKKRDPRDDKATMRRLHGYAPTDDEPVVESDDEGDEDDLNFDELDEFG